MDPEQPIPSQETNVEMYKTRILSDAEFLRAGAEYERSLANGNMRLEITKEQYNKAHKEMTEGLEGVAKTPQSLNFIVEQTQGTKPIEQENYPVIELPENPRLRTFLTRKYAECALKMDSLCEQNSVQSLESFSDLLYKSTILEELLKNSRLNTFELLEDLIQNNNNIDIGLFKDACKDIKNYIDNPNYEKDRYTIDRLQNEIMAGIALEDISQKDFTWCAMRMSFIMGITYEGAFTDEVLKDTNHYYGKLMVALEQRIRALGGGE